MASSYKLTKAEFGLRSYSVALPDVSDDSTNDFTTHRSTNVVKSRSFDLHPKDKTAGPSIKDKLKGWLRGGSPRKKAVKAESREDEQLTVSHKDSPLHKRSWLTGKNLAPTELEQVQAQGSPSLVKLSIKRKVNEIYQITLRSNNTQAFGMLYSAGLPPITVTFIEPGSQAEDAGVKIGDVLMSVNGVDCFNPNLSISQLMEIKATINQTNDATVAVTAAKKKEEKERLIHPLQAEIEDKLSQNSSDLEVTCIDSDSDITTEHQNPSNQQNKAINVSAHSGLLTAHTKESEPLVLRMTLEMEGEKSAQDVDFLDIPKLIPSLGLEEGHSRRDIVTRRRQKHRPATNRQTLLLESDEAVRMGTTRVEVPASLPSSPVKITVDSYHQSNIQTEICSSYPSSAESQVRMQQFIPKHLSSNETESPFVGIIQELRETLLVNNSRSKYTKCRSAEKLLRTPETSSKEGVNPTSRVESRNLNPVPLNKEMFLSVEQGIFPSDLGHENSAESNLRETRHSLVDELYSTSIKKESTTASNLQAGPEDGQKMHHSTAGQSTTSPMSTRAPSEHIPVSAGSSTAVHTMKRGRSYTFGSTTVQKGNAEFKVAALSSKGTGSLEDLTAPTSNQQSTTDSLLPRKGLVKARMAMFQKQ